jgi:hypothetical protein
MDMSNTGIRRWALLGGLAAGALLAACESKNPPPRELDTWPKTGIEAREGRANQGQTLESFGDAQQEEPQPATGGSGIQQQPGQGAPGVTTPREDGDGSEVLRDTQTEMRDEPGEHQR